MYRSRFELESSDFKRMSLQPAKPGLDFIPQNHSKSIRRHFRSGIAKRRRSHSTRSSVTRSKVAGGDAIGYKRRCRSRRDGRIESRRPRMFQSLAGGSLELSFDRRRELRTHKNICLTRNLNRPIRRPPSESNRRLAAGFVARSSARRLC